MLQFTAIIIGLTPGLFWLYYFLKKDCHPEPKKLIIGTFALGILSAPIAAFFEWGVLAILKDGFSPNIQEILEIFIAIALVEEVIKFFMARIVITKSSAFDEPNDAMVYLITVGLGFASLENILAIFKLLPSIAVNPNGTFEVYLIRFLGATLIHALCTGIVGYYFARSYFKLKHRFTLIAEGLIFATLLHGFYNYSMTYPTSVNLQILIILIFFATVTVSHFFKNLNHLKSICEIK